ncbi:PRD domain-containing protein [Halanaerobium saccharolyticum]|uniref:PRD domain-containing protein n=1 Tax=Halanaerobium saccharolyticum TaxID=43595 RepID=A0A4R7Z5D1_9FIRM|nr:PRD domain-containing protein [Halanaerobium saccharolyticum]RAK12478.1 PRD domain-containing protein [Halanaerobium saccharolyticum]TDW06404.1 PRD domain-containing protein [Halanaerobium saccharolyticum]TDX61652.1 PRD domain-containing protein [Halanaerobium saccharolyticum]
MDPKLKQRLEILVEGDQLETELKKKIESLLKKFESDFNLELKNENAAMLVTHLPMALMRIKKGEEVEDLNEMVLAELKKEKFYSDCMDFIEQIEAETEIEIPAGEKNYLVLHFGNLIKKEGGNK